MRVCILCSTTGNVEKLKDVGKGIAMGLESQNHSADILDTTADADKKLTIYDYLVIVSEPVSAFSGKINDKLGRYLENAGVVSGKRAATVIVGGLLKQKAMSNLMRIVEGQGIILKTSEFLKSSGEGKAFGSKLNVERNY